LLRSCFITLFFPSRGLDFGDTLKHYQSQADKALPAVVFGLIGRVGQVGDQRMALLTNLIRAELAVCRRANKDSKNGDRLRAWLENLRNPIMK